jgi:gliding motility-associated-like protein
VVYSFVITNASGADREGIRLFDNMPGAFYIKRILENPFGGTVTMEGNILDIRDMNVKIGQDTIKVLVEIGPDALGLYRNQAVLSGLPVQLGGFTVSDNPKTLIEQDSTDIFIEDFDLSFIRETYQLCRGDSILVDALQYGIRYEWYDGDQSPRKWFTTPGNYSLRARSLCEEILLNIEITANSLDVDILQEDIEVDLGDVIFLESVFSNDNNNVKFSWNDTDPSTLDCNTCQNTSGMPLNTYTYILTIENEEGCIAEDFVNVRVNKERNVFSPNILRVNSLSNNDRFFLSGNQKISKGKSLNIYDRWGNNVFSISNFELNDNSVSWNGMFNGKPVAIGVFTWVAEIEYIDSFIQVIKGDITIVR